METFSNSDNPQKYNLRCKNSNKGCPSNYFCVNRLHSASQFIQIFTNIFENIHKYFWKYSQIFLKINSYSYQFCWGAFWGQFLIHIMLFYQLNASLAHKCLILLAVYIAHNILHTEVAHCIRILHATYCTLRTELTHFTLHITHRACTQLSARLPLFHIKSPLGVPAFSSTPSPSIACIWGSKNFQHFFDF